MFGLLRVTFALMVVLNHLFVGASPFGTYAVFGFYIISGYLMTLIMHESYGYTAVGRYSFAVNRFLRLFPQYWAAVLLSITLILVFGQEFVSRYHTSIYVPNTLDTILQNFSMLFTAWYPNHINPRLVPPAWSLTVEMFFYLLICLGISKTAVRVKYWLFASLIYLVASYFLGFGRVARYYPVVAASLPFAIGAAVYFSINNNAYFQQFKWFRISTTGLFILMLANCFAWTIFSKYSSNRWSEIGFYLNLLICSLLIYNLATGKLIVAIDRKVDKKIGDFSYPIYLLHWQSGLIASYLIFGKPIHEFSGDGLVVLLCALFIIILFSYGLIHAIDHPVQRIRSGIKSEIARNKTGLENNFLQ